MIIDIQIESYVNSLTVVDEVRFLFDISDLARMAGVFATINAIFNRVK